MIRIRMSYISRLNTKQLFLYYLISRVLPFHHACKDYDKKITTILKCKNYNDGIRKNQESNQELEQQDSHKNKRIKRILVVDDEYDITLAIKVVLEENGFKVDSFNDASEALENFSTGLHDLVILDVKMPGMSGFSLYSKIRKWMVTFQFVF